MLRLFPKLPLLCFVCLIFPLSVFNVLPGGFQWIQSSFLLTCIFPKAPLFSSPSSQPAQSATVPMSSAGTGRPFPQTPSGTRHDFHRATPHLHVIRAELPRTPLGRARCQTHSDFLGKSSSVKTLRCTFKTEFDS